MVSITSLPDDILVKIMMQIAKLPHRSGKPHDFFIFASTCKRLALLAAERIPLALCKRAPLDYSDYYEFLPLALYVQSCFGVADRRSGPRDMDMVSGCLTESYNLCQMKDLTRALQFKYKTYNKIHFRDSTLIRNSLGDELQGLKCISPENVNSIENPFDEIDLTPTKIHSLVSLTIDDCVLSQRWFDEALTKLQGLKYISLENVCFTHFNMDHNGDSQTTRRSLVRLSLKDEIILAANQIYYLAYICPAENLVIRGEKYRHFDVDWSAILFYLRKNCAAVKSLSFKYIDVDIDYLRKIVSDTSLSHLKLSIQSLNVSSYDSLRFENRIEFIEE